MPEDTGDNGGTGSSDLSALLNARSVVVVGASRNPAAFGNLAIRNLQQGGFTGVIHAVHSTEDEILGITCARSIAELPEGIDLCVVAVRAELVPDIVRECAARGVRAVTVVGSGFAESGTEEGAARQQDLVETSRAAGMLLLGPNTLGAASFTDKVVSAATANIPPLLRAGNVGIVSQSGGLGTTILAAAAQYGLGVDSFVAVGNEAGIGAPDAIDYFVARGLSAVLCYVETIRDVAAFRDSALLANDAGIPVIVLKGGTEPGGQAITASHTASLAGSTRVLDAAFREWGVQRVRSIDSLVASGALFERFGPPRGRRCGVLGLGGGNSALLADAIERAGLELATVSPDTSATIREILPDSNATNPLDPGGWFLGRGGDLLPRALDAFVADEHIDVMLYGMVPLSAQRESVYLEGIAASAAATAKPTVCLSGHAPPTEARTERFAAAGVLELPCTEAATEALQVWLTERAAHPARAAEVPELGRESADRLAALLAELAPGGTRTFLEDEAIDLLTVVGLEFPDVAVAHDPAEAAPLAATLGFPVVVKALAPGLAHRAQVGAVALGLTDEEETAAAAGRVVANARRVLPPAADIRVLVQRQAPPGTEMIVGIQRDPVFGPVVIVGLGGVWSETFDDVAFVLAPVTAERTRAALHSLRSGAQLGRLVAAGAFDEEHFVDLVVRVGHAAARLGDSVESVDLNPVIVTADGLALVDALAVLRGPAR